MKRLVILRAIRKVYVVATTTRVVLVTPPSLCPSCTLLSVRGTPRLPHKACHSAPSIPSNFSPTTAWPSGLCGSSAVVPPPTPPPNPVSSLYLGLPPTAVVVLAHVVLARPAAPSQILDGGFALLRLCAAPTPALCLVWLSSTYSCCSAVSATVFITFLISSFANTPMCSDSASHFYTLTPCAPVPSPSCQQQ